jgi:orotidine-5'-phosphate decarboxylase
LIVALDAVTLREALASARRLQGVVRRVKVGSILFTAAGPEAVARLRALGFGVMLDLKFFDIPSTVAGSCRAAVQLRVSMLTIHAAGQAKMLAAASSAVREESARRRVTPPLVLGVTVLTSDGQARSAAVTRRVVRLAEGALASGCDGVVASAQEAQELRRRFGHRLRLVCPGIRPEQGGVQDQRRIATPTEAIRWGADFLVVGRPITAAEDPRSAAASVLSEMEAAG